MRTPVKNFSISEQGVFQVPKTAKIGTVNSGVFVSEAQFWAMGIISGAK